MSITLIAVWSIVISVNTKFILTLVCSATSSSNVKKVIRWSGNRKGNCSFPPPTKCQNPLKLSINCPNQTPFDWYCTVRFTCFESYFSTKVASIYLWYLIGTANPQPSRVIFSYELILASNLFVFWPILSTVVVKCKY